MTAEQNFWAEKEFLKRVREGVGLSQEGLAQATGITRSVIANYESGRSPLSSLEHALKIYMVLVARVPIPVGKRDPSARADAARAVLAILDIITESCRSSLEQVERDIKSLRGRQKGLRGQLSTAQSEAKRMERLLQSIHER